MSLAQPTPSTEARAPNQESHMTMGPQIVKHAATVDAETAAATLLKDGGVIVENLLDESALQALNNDFDPHLQAAQDASGEIQENSIIKKNQTVLDALVSKSTQFVRLIDHPLLTGVADRVLKKNCINYQVNGTSINQLEPGAVAQDFHRDDSNYPMPSPRCEMLIITMWALTDFTRENGATMVVPGSHLWEDSKRQLMHQGLTDLLPEDLRQPQEDQVAYAEMPAGSCLIFLGSTLHAGGANKSKDEIRRGMYLGYSLGWLRQEENQYLAIPPQRAREIPDPALKLLGYEMHGGLTGWVGYGRDPIELFR